MNNFLYGFFFSIEERDSQRQRDRDRQRETDRQTEKGACICLGGVGVAYMLLAGAVGYVVLSLPAVVSN